MYTEIEAVLEKLRSTLITLADIEDYEYDLFASTRRSAIASEDIVNAIHQLETLVEEMDTQL